MPKKRRGAKGDGYIAWDKNRQRWRATIPLPEGGSRTKYFGRTDQAAAEEWRVEQLKAIREKRDLRSDRQIVKDALSELLADRDYLRNVSLQNYRLYGRHINTAIGHLPVGDVQPQDIARMDRAHRETLSKRVADYILTLASMLFKRLLALRVITFDPVAAYMTITPARARGGKPPRPTVKLDAGMCRRILEKIEPRFREPCLWFMVYGFRWGELCGLRRVNIQGGVISIVEQRRARTRWEASETKTPQSERELPVVLPVPPGDSDLVFATETGAPLHYNTFREALELACKEARVTYPRPHGLRHTAASGIRRLGCDLDYVAQFLGHKRRSQTEEYAEGTIDQLRPYIEQWARMLGAEVIEQRETGT